MKNKGLCTTCVNDKECTFPRKFPVLQCEEFDGFRLEFLGKKKKKREKIEFWPKPVVWE